MSTGRGFAKDSSLSAESGWNDEELSLDGDARNNSSPFQPDSADIEESFADPRAAGEGHDFRDGQEEGDGADSANEDRGMNVVMSDVQQPWLPEDDMLLYVLNEDFHCHPDEATAPKLRSLAQERVTLEVRAKKDSV